ncbi:MAG: hypothetical protein AABW67_00405 [Nanoarchaeota archaeon]
MEEKINMVAAASRVLSYDKQHPTAIPEDILQDASDFIHYSKADENTKLLMVAAASKALEILRKNPRFNHRQVLSEVMQELDSIIEETSKENKEIIN